MNDAARECAEEIVNSLAFALQQAGVVKNAVRSDKTEMYEVFAGVVAKHFPPAQESETRSGCVPVGKLEALAKKWRVAPRNGLSDEAAALYFSTLLNAASDLEALIAEAK